MSDQQAQETTGVPFPHADLPPGEIMLGDTEYEDDLALLTSELDALVHAEGSLIASLEACGKGYTPLAAACRSLRDQAVSCATRLGGNHGPATAG